MLGIKFKKTTTIPKIKIPIFKKTLGSTEKQQFLLILIIYTNNYNILNHYLESFNCEYTMAVHQGVPRPLMDYHT